MQKIIKCLYIFIYLLVKKKKTATSHYFSAKCTCVWLTHEDDFSLRPGWYFCTVVKVGDFVLLPFILDW